MPIGSYRYLLTRNPLRGAVRFAFGTLDLHSHLRLRPMLNYVQTHSAFRVTKPLRVLELGCGSGINLFELAARFQHLRGLGYDLHIADAESAATQLFHGRLTFRQADLSKEYPQGEFDIVLLMDFLEHVSNPEEVLRLVSQSVRVGGEVLVSVPTTRYPRIFGREFHRSVGHVVDGYNLPELNAMMPDTLTLLQHRYSTGLLASLLCALCYRFLPRTRSKAIVSLFTLCVLPFVAVDLLNGPRRSCSLFAAYQRV